MGSLGGIFSMGFVTINLLFALITGIAALFFAFSSYLHNLGIAPAMSGLIISADALAALIVQPLIAPLVHAGTARRWLVTGSLVLSAALFMVGHVSTVPLLLVARLLQGAGFVCVLASLITMLVRYIPPGMSGRAFGYLSIIRLIPYAVVPLLFDLLSIEPLSFGTVLNKAAIAALLPALLLILPLPTESELPETYPPPGLKGMKESLRSRPVVLLLLSAMLFFCGYSAMFFYLKQFGSSIGIADPGSFFTVATVVMIIVRLLGGGLFDRYDKTLLGAAGLFAAAACYGLLPFCTSGSMFLLLAGFSGVGWGIAMPLQAASMFDISSPAARALNQNLLLIMMQGGFFIGPFLGGQAISHAGYNALFAGLAATAFTAGIIMTGVRKTDESRKTTTFGGSGFD